MGIGAGIGSAGNAATHHVANAEDGCALALGQFQSRQGIGRFAALRDGNHDVALRDNRIAVAELRGVLDLHRNAGQVLNQIFGHQAGVPARAARHNDDAVGINKLLLVGAEASHIEVATPHFEAAAHRIEDRTRLLKNLLEHKVLVTTFFNTIQLQLQALDVGRLHHVFARADGQLAVLDNSELVVVDVHHLVGVLDDGGSVGSHEELALANTNNQRRTLAGRNELVGLVLAQHHNGVGTYYFVQRQAHGFFQRASVLRLNLLDEVDEYFGVRIRMEYVALLLQVCLQRSVVLNDAIVDKGNPLRGRVVRMGVHIVGLAVGSPAGVAHAHGGVRVFGSQKIFELRYFAFLLIHAQRAVEQGHTGRVVAAVFEAVQPFENNWTGLPMAQIRYDAAHGK